MQTNLTTRDLSQNYFKAFLVIGMILSHALQLLTQPSGYFLVFTVYINLITFSGFMFSFGYIYQKAYGKKKVDCYFAINKMKTTLFAFYISAFCWKLIIEHELTFRSIIMILIFKNVPPYSEFLLAFFLTTAVFFLFKNKIATLINSKYVIILLLLLLFISFAPFYKLYTNFVFWGHIIYLDYYIGLIFGSLRLTFFPIFQYLIFFMLGIWFQKNKISYSKPTFIVSILSTLIFLSYLYLKKELPQRFPPSPFWLIGSFFFLYLYLICSRKLKQNKLTAYLNLIGENSLIYLLLSNVLIFSLKNTLHWNYISALIGGLGVIVFITYNISITRIFNQHEVVKKIREKDFNSNF